MGRKKADFSGENNPNYKTGYAVVGQKPSFYNSWQNMKARCLRHTHPKYKRYGGRGIRICDEWLSIEGFSKWALSSGWKEGLSLDRVNNDGDYTPENCRWVSLAENSRKKSTTKLTKTDAQEIRDLFNRGYGMDRIAEKYDITSGNVWWIVKNYTHVSDGECTKKLKSKGSEPLTKQAAIIGQVVKES